MPKTTRRKFINVMVLGTNGKYYVNQCGIIHEWHTDTDITVEWLDWLDIDSAIFQGYAIDTSKESITLKNCEDICLDDIKKYSLHFSWGSAIGEILRLIPDWGKQKEA